MCILIVCMDVKLCRVAMSSFSHYPKKKVKKAFRILPFPAAPPRQLLSHNFFARYDRVY